MTVDRPATFADLYCDHNVQRGEYCPECQAIEARRNGQDPEDRTNGHVENDDEPPPLLPEEFWQRQLLGKIRTAARARGAAPDAVFGAVLAGVAARVSPYVVLPPIVGGHGSLNLCVALLGASGTGKGVAMRTGEDLLPEFAQNVGTAPLGTGQGMIETYFTKQKEGEGHARRLEGCLFVADEGQMLTKLAEGQGSVTLETMRASFNGEQVGTQTVGAPWRVLDRHTYRMVFLLGLQPAMARPILADTAGGTPQRFLWFGVVDPDAPVEPPKHPGQIAWDPYNLDIREQNVEVGGRLKLELAVAQAIRTEVLSRRHEVLTAKRTPGPYESHRELLRLKVAASLAILDDCRADVTADDWSLAGLVVDTSDAVRESIRKANRLDDYRAEAGRNVKAASRAAAEEAARRRVNDYIRRVARNITNKVGRLHEEGTLPVARADLRRAVAHRDRDRFDEALGHAEAMGWVVSDDDGRYDRGQSQPAE